MYSIYYIYILPSNPATRDFEDHIFRGSSASAGCFCVHKLTLFLSFSINTRRFLPNFDSGLSLRYLQPKTIVCGMERGRGEDELIMMGSIV